MHRQMVSFLHLFFAIWLAPLQAAIVADDPPTQIHINLGNMDGTAVTFSWVTAQVTVSKVLLRVKHGDYVNHISLRSAERYNFTSPYGATYTSGLIHHLTVSDLLHDTKYFYRCGSTAGGFSDEYTFHTPPQPSADAEVTFAVVGDIGQTHYSKKNMEDMSDDRSLKSLVIVGDLSYADSAEPSMHGTPCGQERWDSWFEMMQPLFANTLVMTLPGNHEVEYIGAPPPATQVPFLAYSKRLQMPGPNRLYYSYNYGSVHIVMLNSYMEFGKGSPQYNFLADDLAAVNRQVTPWLVVNFHAPWYNSNTHHHQEIEEEGMRQAMEDLLYQYEVDIAFSGHVHNYERMHPVYRNKTTPGSVTHIVVGDGGNREGPALGWFQRPEWSAFRLDQEEKPERIFGHGKVQVMNRTHMLFTWRSLRKSNSHHSDSVWLIKNTALNNGLQRGVSAVY